MVTRLRAGLLHDSLPCPDLCSHLDPVGLGAASCVQKLWRDHICHEDSLWRAICASRLGMESGPVGLNGQPLPTYREAFLSWHQAVGKYGVLAERAYRAWRKIERWTAEHIPQVAASLRCATLGCQGGLPVWGVELDTLGQ